jgi:hypothetical protein
LKADTIPPAPVAKAAAASNLTDIGPLDSHPELSDFMKHFPGARIEEQKRR